MSASSKEHIEQLIHEAFAEVPYPGDEAIAYHRPDHSSRGVVDKFKGVHWRDVPRDVPAYQHCWLHWFSPAGRRFYLPAYLLLALGRLQETSTYHPVLFSLDPPEDTGRFEREYGTYTSQQKRAIRLFLEYARDEAVDRQSARRVAQDALERYWARDEETLARSQPEPTRKAQLKHLIRDAFSNVPYPGDEAIGDASPPGAAVNQDFNGYHFCEVPRDVLAFHSGDLPAFSPAGEQFYLPTYLLAALDDFHEVLDRVIHHLADLDEIESVHRHEGYTAAQRSAIRLFLEHVRGAMEGDEDRRSDCRLALDKYWGWPADGTAQATVELAHQEHMRQIIVSAFAAVPPPGRDALISRDDKGDEGSSALEIELDFDRRRPCDLPREVLLRHRHHLAFFSAEALQYYLPAYLLAALDEPRDVVYWVLLELQPSSLLKEHLERFRSRFDRYSPAQREAIRLFLEHVRDTMPHISLGGLAQRALDRCWAEVGG